MGILGHGAGGNGSAQIEWASDGAFPKYFWAWGGAILVAAAQKFQKKTPFKQCLRELEGCPKGGGNLPPPFGPSTTSPSAQIGGVTVIFGAARRPILKSTRAKIDLPTHLGLQRRHRRAKRGG